MKLDRAYANHLAVPDADGYPPRWSEKAAGFREKLVGEGRAELGLSYGPTARQAYDLFLPEGPSQGVVIFVHGGYWRRFDRSFWSHLAAGPLARGWSVAMPSYDLCPEVRIADITRQIARAVEAIAAHVPGPVALAGHSAGGHLVARMLAPGMLSEATGARLTRVTPISPVSDLRPLLETSMNAEFFHMDIEDATAESPALVQDRPPVPVTVWVGADELPAFLDQARWLAEAWSCPLHLEAGTHHFDVIDGLADPDSALVADILP
ncbi:alpha/beta hydrolase [Roseovarius aestuariivivens]|uniref:alpha/beta hydrolase n=1 Tax=Roseovarius aestuariivivens TaxID=1888910 RepID=UPI0010804F32|nr:alpha/beta hydrolase [Roseovarius aestuariivivens]